MGAPTCNTNRLLMLVFAEHNDEIEVVNAGAKGDILDDVMTTYAEWDLSPDNVNAVLSFVQYMGQRRELVRARIQTCYEQVYLTNI